MELLRYPFGRETRMEDEWYLFLSSAGRQPFSFVKEPLLGYGWNPKDSTNTTTSLLYTACPFCAESFMLQDDIVSKRILHQ